ncbi:MAG: glycosyltransferase family 39 protein [Phycisphaerales bacterium]|nr:glycosyltransferase family 39 protein [Phycisphaerales bacterium]
MTVTDTLLSPAPLAHPPSLRQLLPVFLGPLLIAATFFTLLYATWNGWIAPLSDFGRELYVPWKLAEGSVLYRDITSFYGPLSPLANALFFRLFGPNILTLMLVNCIVLAMATFFLHEIIRTISTRFTAAIVCMFFLAVFGFSRLLPDANFCFIAPYSHEATHGFTLSLAAIYCFICYVRSLRGFWIAAVGLCVGLVFLTKPESFIALIGFLTFATTLKALRGSVVVGHHSQKSPSNSLCRAANLLLLAGFAILPITAAVIYLAIHMPLSMAWHGTLGSWTFLANSTVTGGKFFRDCMGFDAPLAHLTQTVKTAGIFLMLIGPATLMSFFLPDGRLARRALGCALGIASIILIRTFGPTFPWTSLGSLLLLGSLALAICQTIVLIQNRNDPTLRTKLVLTVFAMLMLLKMLLATRVYHYGFILGVMAASMLVVSLVDWLPSALERHNKCGWIFRGAALAILVSLGVRCATASYANLPDPHHLMGQGKNQLRAHNAAVYQDMLQFMQTQIPADRTLLVLPEGAILNFLSRRQNPLPYITFLPSDLDMFTEPRLLESLQHHRPDYIALTHRSSPEFGPASFGFDYATSISTWITANYSQLHLSGSLPYTSANFGILLFRRNDIRH